MAITTVFLDLYQTVAHFYPPREQRQARILKEFGFDVDEVALQKAYLTADVYYTRANTERPLQLLSAGEKDKVYSRFHQILLEEVGLAHACHLSEQLYRRYGEVEREFRLFPDVEPALAQLLAAGYRLGLITNIDSDPTALLEGVGIKDAFDLMVASCTVGYDKPDPRIFRYALDSLGARPEEAIHVGDLICSDIVGAEAAGMKAVLLDRYDLQEGLHPYRITSLLELPALIKEGLS